jgi:hypothetical protein
MDNVTQKKDRKCYRSNFNYNFEQDEQNKSKILNKVEKK